MSKLQDASQEIWETKYQLKDKAGNIIDKTIDSTFDRVARELANVEVVEKREEWQEKFNWALENGAIPAGRILSNTGAGEHKPATSTINCTVSGTVEDSMSGILDRVKEAGMTLKAGCVSADTQVLTEKGLVTAKEAVLDKHNRILAYDKDSREILFKDILDWLTPTVEQKDNINISFGQEGSITTSILHPILVYREGKLQYIPAGEIEYSDALVRSGLEVHNPTDPRQIRVKRELIGTRTKIVISQELRDFLVSKEHILRDVEKQNLGYDRHLQLEKFTTKDILDKWHAFFGIELENIVPFTLTLTEVVDIQYGIECSPQFYDFTVEGTNNYLAGINGLVVIHNCGIGYEFSTLRHKGAYVKGAGAYTSGPLSFMDIFDKTCFTVSSAGGRRGAQMATFDISHPDVLEYIKAKREDGRLRQFNLSLLITKEFMEAVKTESIWNFLDVATKEVVSSMPAVELWNTIMSSTYDFAEPGFILIDKVNEMNNNWFCENIRATNPCGEQPLPPYGSCLLGSINLTKMVEHPFSPVASFDIAKYAKVIRIFTRMLDNVVEVNNLPLKEQREEIYRKRRHGMGFLGLGSAMAMLGITYGSAESVEFTDLVAKVLAEEGWKEGVALAREKGEAPIMLEDFTVTQEMLDFSSDMVSDGYSVGDTVKGRTLFAKYGKYMALIKSKFPKLAEDLEKYGSRFTHHSSIAPTGTISLSIANNASNGIEPSFAHHYSRNVIKEGKKSKEKVDVFSYELLKYRETVDKDATPASLPECFVTTDSITPRQHVDVQAAAQKWVDSSISKTINVPTDIEFSEFEDIYMYAYDKGLKGCTTFRFNPEAFQGVLVKDEDLKNTKYKFTLEDGHVLEVTGEELIDYDGEAHTAANLFDALKEGYYGKF